MVNKFLKDELQLTKLSKSIGEEVDLFICSASYEERCLSIPNNIEVSQVQNVIILQNENVLGKGKEHAQVIQDRFGEAAKKITISKERAMKTGDEIINLLAPYHESTKLNCYIDITCMTHEALLVLFIVIREILPASADMKFLYTPAKEYDPGTEERYKWLSKGLSDVRSVLGYPGELLPSQKNELIVLVGFEVERTVKLIEAFEPNFISFGLGVDQPVDPDHKVINEQKHERLSLSYPNAMTFEFSPTNPYSVRDTVLDLASQNEDRNIIVAPMNTKLSTLGVALAAFANLKIQVCYAPAAIYNVHNYSTPKEICYMFEIEL